MSRVRGVRPSKLAKELGVHRTTIWRWIGQHRIQIIPYGPKTNLIPYSVYQDIVKNGLPIEY